MCLVYYTHKILTESLQTEQFQDGFLQNTFRSFGWRVGRPNRTSGDNLVSAVAMENFHSGM